MSSRGAPVRVLAPAKINPFLEVVGRREDGYHELDTTLLALDLCDELEARVTDDGVVRLEVLGPFASADVPRDGSNLAARAAAAVLEFARSSAQRHASSGLELTLRKCVPSRAGLGGGSSDAAAAMLAAERALEVALPRGLAERALGQLGSDCVFFRAAADSGFARCTGRGEVVQALAPVDARWTIAVVTPAVEAPTAAVYAALAPALRNQARAPTLPPDVFERSETEARQHLFNRLEDACLALLPDLRDWRRLLDAAGASHFRLCGSGSSFFGLYAARSVARRALLEIETAASLRGRAWRGTWLARPLGRGAHSVPCV